MAKVINVRGPLIPNDYKWIYDFLEYESVCPNDICNALHDALESNESLILRINSSGGYVSVGADIYENLMNSEVEVEARVVGNCCSAATYLVCAANKSTMSPLGQFMIHRSSVSGVSGDANDLESVYNSLNETDRAIANAYSLKTGMSHEEIMTMMEKETWMSADTALNYGFIDEILFTDTKISKNMNQISTGAVNSMNCLIDENIINEMLKNKSHLNCENKEIEIAKARLNLMKIGGKTNG